MDPLYQKVVDLYGEEALVKLSDVIRDDEASVPDLCAQPSDWIEGSLLDRRARESDEDSRSGSELEALRRWLAGIGDGSWKAGLDL